jgi:hypothetical protein
MRDAGCEVDPASARTIGVVSLTITRWLLAGDQDGNVEVDAAARVLVVFLRCLASSCDEFGGASSSK